MSDQHQRILGRAEAAAMVQNGSMSGDPGDAVRTLARYRRGRREHPARLVRPTGRHGRPMIGAVGRAAEEDDIGTRHGTSLPYAGRP